MYILPEMVTVFCTLHLPSCYLFNDLFNMGLLKCILRCIILFLRAIPSSRMNSSLVLNNYHSKLHRFVKLHSSVWFRQTNFLMFGKFVIKKTLIGLLAPLLPFLPFATSAVLFLFFLIECSNYRRGFTENYRPEKMGAS